MDETRQRCLSYVPDLPIWVETRDLLLWEGSTLIENAARSGFVVWSAEDGLGSVVGDPEPDALARAVREVSELIAFADNVELVRSLLPGFSAEPATIFIAPEQLPSVPLHPCRMVSPGEIDDLAHLPAELLAELVDAADDEIPVAAACDGTLPVAFAYVASESESLWDMSIDTIESHRRQGYASAAALHLMRIMKKRGKSAVWGALETNRASANLARRLGFVESGNLWVLTRSAP